MENLASKYRPKTLEDVVEQDVVIDIVKNICKAGEVTNRNFLFIGPAGTGKAQPLYSKVLTVSGYKQMADIELGDEVVTHKGNIGKVIGIFPQGKRPIHRIELEDSASIDVADNHLNIVTSKDSYGNNLESILTTDYLIYNSQEGQYSIPVATGVDLLFNKLHLSDPFRDSTKRRISRISYVGLQECQCIYIDHPDHTYISDDFIPTHNTTTARAIARILNEGKGEPIEVDAASHSGIDSVRTLIEQMRIHPVGTKYKIFIIDECHSLSPQSWQALLKTIEEQPAKTINCFCVSGEGFVQTPQGLKKMNSVEPGDEVWDGIKFRKVLNFFDNGEKDCISIKLSNGLKITCTRDHMIEVLKDDSIIWKRADEIKVTDYLLLHNNFKVADSIPDISQEEAWMLGYITGNGNYTSHSLNLYTPLHKWGRVKECLDALIDQGIIKDYIVDSDERACDNNIHDTRIHFYSDKYHAGMRNWYAKTGMNPDYTRGTKQIPTSVYNMSADNIRAFTEGWYFADGSGTCSSFFSSGYDDPVTGKRIDSPFLYCSNYNMISSLQNILQSIGVYTALRESKNVITEEMYKKNPFIKPGEYISYVLYVLHKPGFFNEPGFRQILLEKYRNMPTGKYKLKLAQLHNLTNIAPAMLEEAGYTYTERGLFFPVASIEDAGSCEVFDIEVEGTHKFIYNGLVVHNCTTNPEKIPPTILSRVQTFQLSKISLEGIYNRLKYIIEQENKEGAEIQYDDDAILFLAKTAQGGMRDAITSLDQCLSFNKNVTVENVTQALDLPDYDDYFELLNAIVKKDNSVIVKIVNTVYNSGANFTKWFDGFFSFIINIVKFIYLQDINQTMIPSTYQEKIAGYGTKHSALCLKLSNKLVKMNQELKTTQYLQELAISYLCSAPKQ